MSLFSKVGRLGLWRLALGLAVMWSWLPASWAAEEQLQTAVQKEPEKVDGKKKGDGKAKEKKPSPELEKARAQVKELGAQMKKLHEQMRDTGEKLRKAMGEVAKLSGPKESKWGSWWGKGAEMKKKFGHSHGKGPWGHHGWAKGHGWHGFKGWHGPWGGPPSWHGFKGPWGGPPSWHRFGGGPWGPPGRDRWQGPAARSGAPSSSDLEGRLDRLQRELEELRRELGRKK